MSCLDECELGLPDGDGGDDTLIEDMTPNAASAVLAAESVNVIARVACRVVARSAVAGAG